MKSTLLLAIILMASAVNANECEPLQAKQVASAFLKKERPNFDLYMTSVGQKRTLDIYGQELTGNLEVRYTQIDKADKQIAETGVIELHPETCRFLRRSSQSVFLQE